MIRNLERLALLMLALYAAGWLWKHHRGKVVLLAAVWFVYHWG